MLDFKKEIMTALTPILPTYYSYIRDDKMPIPCITYIEYRNDQDKTMGSNICWSNVGYTIRIYDTDVSTLTTNAQLVDIAMRQLDYQRIGSQETIESNLLCKILVYNAYAEEHFKEVKII